VESKIEERGEKLRRKAADLFPTEGYFKETLLCEPKVVDLDLAS